MTRAAGPTNTTAASGFRENLYRKQNTEDKYKGIITSLYKKGDRKKCGNYKGIKSV
jgi:hypothetical protein